MKQKNQNVIIITLLQNVLQQMSNGDPKRRIFLSYPHPNNGFFFLLSTVYLFILK